MSILHSPLTGSQLEGSYIPRPRNAFLMLTAHNRATEVELEMESAVRAVLNEFNFVSCIASETPGTGDYLKKIVDLIRGCGFCIAIYLNKTRSSTMGNIFFEAGVAQLMGKPVHLLTAGKNITPSDFVRHNLYSPPLAEPVPP